MLLEIDKLIRRLEEALEENELRGHSNKELYRRYKILVRARKQLAKSYRKEAGRG